MKYDQLIIVRSATYLETLIEKFNSKAQAKFYLERSGKNFSEIEQAHERFYESLNGLKASLDVAEKFKIIDRTFLPNYIFTKNDFIIGFGQDGLVANIAKYANTQPILGLNPDPIQYDGILLPFTSLSRGRLNGLLNGEFNIRNVVMAKAEFNDGQSLLAFNDFFIGPKSHTSARYKISYNDISEHQSSSGIIVSTGIGSTGWMSSISNMVNSISGGNISLPIKSNSKQLFFAVREPFLSKTSEINISHGLISNKRKLRIESRMIDNGVLFSDGIESDFIPFNIGSTVEISIAKEKACLVSGN